MGILLDFLRKNEFKEGKIYQNHDIQFFEDSDLLSSINQFDITFRFCPYCGSSQSNKKVK